jgi:hypothetical protein
MAMLRRLFLPPPVTPSRIVPFPFQITAPRVNPLGASIVKKTVDWLDALMFRRDFCAAGGSALATLLASGVMQRAFAAADEITPESQKALDLGLEWLAKNQGTSGNWESNDLGLVSMGALAFMAAGHFPGRGKYGKECDKAVAYMLDRSKDSGLLNISDPRNDMYNHGLATFVLGQAHGMVYKQRRDIRRVLDSALKLISQTQCDDGGWDYIAKRQQHGHDLSLAVMQAKALRSALDSGLEVPKEVIDAAITSVRQHYSPEGDQNAPESEQMKRPGQFTYSRGGGGKTVAMAAAGVVCLQEFGQYDDWRIEKSMEFVVRHIRELPAHQNPDGLMPFDAYTLYYVGQALYQVGDKHWRDNYPKLRDFLVISQRRDPRDQRTFGSWLDNGVGAGGNGAGGKVGGKPGELYGTAVACFVLAIPNRYLPILQEGRIEGFAKPKPPASN